MAKTSIQQAQSNHAYAKTGTILGLLLGLALSITWWSHAPDMAHAIFIGVLAVFCAVAGFVIGMVVEKVDPAPSH